jgi:hypothetical protein
MHKVILLFALFVLSRFSVIACDGCRLQQPRILRGLSHGAGPDTQWDYLIVAIAAASGVLTFYYSIKWLIKPGEKSQDHIKNLVQTIM